MSKKLIIIAISFILAISGGYMLATSNPFSWNNGLVGYWSFDGQYTTSTDGTKDVSNTGNYGQFKNGVKPTAGVVGQALSFDGVNDLVSVADSSTLTNTATLTIEAWFNVSDLSSTRTIVGKGTSDADEEYTLIIASTYIYFDVGGANGPYTQQTYTVTTNVWHHIVATHTRSGGSSTLKVYLDGVDLNATTIGPTQTPGDNSTAMTIGSRFAAGNAYFKGAIDEVRIYNRALSANEVKQHYDQTKRNFVAASSVPSSWWTGGLVGYWSFDGQYTTSTDGTKDVSNNGNWGAFNGGPTPKAGVSGQALTFDGVDDYVNAGNGSSLNMTGDMTIEAWIYPRANAFYEIVGNGRDVNYGYRFMTLLTGAVRFDTIQSGASQSTLSNTSTIVPNQWIHIVATRSGTTAKIYKNGIDVTQTPGSHINPITSIQPLRIGVYYDLAQGFFNGLIDEVRIYNRALSANEVKQHYEQTRRNFVAASSVPSSWWTSGLVGYWNFDGKNTTSTNGTRDTSGNNNWGTFSGGPTPKAGIVGQALSFDGVNDYVDAGNAASLNPDAISIELWVKYTGGGRIIAQSSSDWNTPYEIYIKGGGALALYTSNSAPNAYADVITPLAYNDGVWHHVVGVISSTQAIIYVDGVEKKSASWTRGVKNSTEKVLIGASMWGGSPTFFYNGSVDEVRIYNRALSADEVMEHYKQTRRNLRI